MNSLLSCLCFRRCTLKHPSRQQPTPLLPWPSRVESSLWMQPLATKLFGKSHQENLQSLGTNSVPNSPAREGTIDHQLLFQGPSNLLVQATWHFDYVVFLGTTPRHEEGAPHHAIIVVPPELSDSKWPVGDDGWIIHIICSENVDRIP